MVNGFPGPNWPILKAGQTDLTFCLRAKPILTPTEWVTCPPYGYQPPADGLLVFERSPDGTVVISLQTTDNNGQVLIPVRTRAQLLAGCGHLASCSH